MLEHYNPYLIEDTGELWQFHCQREFRSKQRQDMETAREMYLVSLRAKVFQFDLRAQKYCYVVYFKNCLPEQCGHTRDLQKVSALLYFRGKR